MNILWAKILLCGGGGAVVAHGITGAIIDLYSLPVGALIASVGALIATAGFWFK